MIEVEIRGRLTSAEADKLRRFMRNKGKHIESHSREMIRLYDYPGFAEDTLKRRVDIRIRDTDGKCEIMVKKMAAKNNIGRTELSLKLTDNSLETAKAVLKALGYAKGLQMRRKKDVFRYKNIEWSIVEAPKKIFYYEAEREAKSIKHIPEETKFLEDVAGSMGLHIFAPQEYREFIQMLSKKVNKRIFW